MFAKRFLDIKKAQKAAQEAKEEKEDFEGGVEEKGWHVRDYSCNDPCFNPDSYGAVCLRCGRCGRVFRNGRLVSNIGTREKRRDIISTSLFIIVTIIVAIGIIWLGTHC